MTYQTSKIIFSAGFLMLCAATVSAQKPDTQSVDWPAQAASDAEAAEAAIKTTSEDWEPSAEEYAYEDREPVAQTVILDGVALERLRANSGMTLQWISWDYRSPVAVMNRGDAVHISGVQWTADGTGYVSVDGDIAEIGEDYFILQGRIEIVNTPDPGRRCTKEGRSRFAITQNRQYWRMREFEWCDDLTDYIDIYY